ncbi:hypothetical protein [Neobacillus sp. LXY-4]|uniref:hypothetical protein n=1 Tax=Neobacillus sp. LXY-4 TaxID=3379826 RepID=UPI003EE0DBC7
MQKNGNSYDFVGEPLISTGDTEAENKIETKDSKLASKPKIGETIIGDNGIKGRIR